MKRHSVPGHWIRCLIPLILFLSVGRAPAASEPQPLSLVVMDPLAAPLSCPCVEGYAQRKYEKLAEYLEQSLGRPVRLTFSESLRTALAGKAAGRADLIIGKDSVVRADAKAARVEVTAVASLTGKDGATTQTGLFVVPAQDPARQASDLSGYRIFFGASECDEKYAAAIELLRSSGVAVPDKIETSAACSDGACKTLELGAGVRSAAVISSYAQPLLEGCGTVKKGDLRVIGETKPVPFITAFISDGLPAADRGRLHEALLAAGTRPELCAAMETLLGFVPFAVPDEHDVKKKVTTAALAASAEPWTGWRGSRRDGISRTLPMSLPASRQLVWQRKLGGSGLGGLAATPQYVVLGDRDLDDFNDVFRCLDATDGAPVWTVVHPAIGKLDYGNTPRATPLIDGDRVYLLGAFGDLHCAKLATGEVAWSRNLILDFGVTAKQIWGTCSSPLLADGKLIVNPGGDLASLAALDPKSGEVLWQTPGGEAGFGSLIVGNFGGVRQIIGHDRTTLGGWDIQTGTRLWTLAPPAEGDFNVPTPVQVGDRLLVGTENNGTRLYAFDPLGRILPQPVARNDGLAPDMSTPVVVDERVFCVWEDLFCLDLKTGLRTLWTGRDPAFGTYAAVIGGRNRVLVIGKSGELVLADTRADRFEVVSRLRVFDEGPAELYSHPALVGDRLYIRGATSVVCVDLGGR